MTTKKMSYIGSYSGVSKKGNEFTVSHFMCDPDDKQKGVHGKSLLSFFLEENDVSRVLSLKPLQEVEVSYAFAGGNNILITLK